MLSLQLGSDRAPGAQAVVKEEPWCLVGSSTAHSWLGSPLGFPQSPFSLFQALLAPSITNPHVQPPALHPKGCWWEGDLPQLLPGGGACVRAQKLTCTPRA